MTLARELADFVCRQRFQDLPPQAIDHAEMLVASTVASAAMGSTLDSTRIIRALEVERGGRPDSTVWFGAAEKLPAAAAARVNALASDAAASDDSHLDYITHHGTTVCSTTLAVGERTGASGADVTAAIVLGYEVTSRLMEGVGFPFKTKGFHASIVASFSAAVGAARLLGLDAAGMAQAIALTATSGGGLSAAADTSCAREYHAGQAAMNGVNAALAAARGFQAEESVLEARRGFLQVYGDRPPELERVTRGLGERWSILTDMGIKLVPGTHPYHAIAEAAANAARAGDVAPEQVEEITISRPGYQGFANAQVPTDLIGVAHSALYFAAAAVVDRSFGWDHVTEAKINDPRIRALLARVRMVDPPTEHLERFKSGAVVTLRLRDGSQHASTVYAPRGAAVLGIAWADVEAKYRALVPLAQLTGDHLERSLAVIRSFRSVRQVSELTELLC